MKRLIQIFTVVIALLITVSAAAKEQFYQISDANISAVAGGIVEANVSYGVTEQQAVNGFAFRIHYKAADIANIEVNNYFNHGHLGIDTAVADSNDLDNDPDTDKFIIAAWFDPVSTLMVQNGQVLTYLKLTLSENSSEFTDLVISPIPSPSYKSKATTVLMEGEYSIGELVIDNDSLDDAWEILYFNHLESLPEDDNDNDGLSNIEEYELGTNPTTEDTDDDGYNDADEVSAGSEPSNSESLPLDTDGDFISNVTDTDDDNDGYSDVDELANETDSLSAASIPNDYDGDFTSDLLDIDDDNDLVLDIDDVFSMNEFASVDTDLDGFPDSFHDNCDVSCINNSGLILDFDDDNDGIVDVDDSSPLDATIGDDESPIFSMINDVSFEANGVATDIALVAPAVTDNNLNAPSITSDYSVALALGTHEITWTATDFFGNQSTATQLVHIVDTTAPSFDELQVQTIDARGLETDISNDLLLSAYDVVDGFVEARVSGDSLYTSGQHTISIVAEDASGNEVESTADISINPQVGLSQGRKVEPGAVVNVPVHLLGVAASYPVLLEVEVTDTTFMTTTTQLIIEEGVEGFVEVVIPNNAINGDVVSLSLISAVNAVLGDVTGSTLEIVVENYSPTLQLTLEQGDNSISVVDAQGGIVTVTAIIEDLNALDAHDIVWAASDDALTDLDNDSLSSTFEFTPQHLASNTYSLSIDVKENNTNELYEISVDINLVVDADLAALSVEDDSDGDGISDALEGYGDTDNDGIADYLDIDDNPSRLPINDETAPMQTINGLSLSLGNVVSSSNGATAQGAAIDIADIAGSGGVNGETVDNSQDSHYETLSTIINFSVSGLSEVGMTVPVIIPLAEGRYIIEGAKYRKYNSVKGWYDFVEDNDNSILSALADNDGNCPSPLSDEYEQGLIVGNNCIELLIKDGGENDADGLANGMIEDPGVLAVEVQNQAPVINLSNSMQVNEESAVIVDATGTTDAENDMLTYQWSQVGGNTVALLGDNTLTLSFEAPSISSDELLTFELIVDDGIDSAMASIEVLVLQVNKLPTISIDAHNASFDEGQSVSLVAQSTDDDGDAVTYAWEQVSGPAVSFSDNSSATASFTTPQVSNNQTVEFKVTVFDGTDSMSVNTSIVVNDVPAQSTPSKANDSDSGGGSMSWLLILLGLGALRGRCLKQAA